MHQLGPGDNASHLARDFFQVVLRLMRNMAKDMRCSPQSITPGQVAALVRLKRGPVATSELAKHLGVSVPTASRSVNVLVERGWVARSTNPEDRRNTLLRLSATGRHVTAAMRRRSERHIEELLHPLTPAEREVIMTAVAILRRLLPLQP